MGHKTTSQNEAIPKSEGDGVVTAETSSLGTPGVEVAATEVSPVFETLEDEIPPDKWELRRQRRVWIKEQVATVQGTSKLQCETESMWNKSFFCWICTKRGQFQMCPQLASKAPNPKIIIEDAVGAALFASEVSNPDCRPEEVRMVFYTDMSATNGMGCKSQPGRHWCHN